MEAFLARPVLFDAFAHTFGATARPSRIASDMTAVNGSNSQPLVSIVIPVFNGETTLGRAVRSVLAQTYEHFRLTIVDNRSTDATGCIAEEIAAQDRRVRVVHNREFLPVMENYNNAFALIDDDAKYVKVLGADDWLFPACISELVAVAEHHPSVAIVTSWVLLGTRVAFDGLPYPTTVLSGREVCRARLLHNVRVFGGPSASLLRASLVRARRPFYDPRNYHGDAEACLAILEHHDFGYVQQVLSYMHDGEESKTTRFTERVGSYYSGDWSELTNFGPIYLTRQEYVRRLKEVQHTYYTFLAHNLLGFPGREFWRYHFVHLAKQGLRVSRLRLAFYVLLRVVDLVGNPKRTLEGAGRRAALRLHAEWAAARAGRVRKAAALGARKA